jgi:predicted phosphodiesterase
MRYAIIGDIHANLEALQAILKDAKEQEVSHFACLGDVVGYNANPVECLEIVRELECPTVRGNHDHYVAHSDSLEGFHPLAANVVDWTRKQLTDEQRSYLGQLPYNLPVETFTIVHSTLDVPSGWGYVFDKLEAEANFSYQVTSVCFYGHTHVPIAFEQTDIIKSGLFRKLKIMSGRKYFVNVGSVGQPRDGDPRAAYVIFDMINNQIELRRIPYDFTVTQKKILENGLPERLASRLAIGR